MDFATNYRRLLHAEFDELLDVDDEIYIAGPSRAMNKPALSRRVARKWAFDEIIRANSKAKFGQEEVVKSLRTSIETYQNLIYSKSPANSEDRDSLNENYRASISHIEAFILKLNP